MWLFVLGNAMSFFKNLFNKNQQAERQLNSVNELTCGDIIKLTDSFALPELLRDQEFQVNAVNSYEFEHQVQTEWVLNGNHGIEIYLSLEEDDHTLLKFAIKLTEQDVETLFDLEQFGDIFEEPGQAQLIRQQGTEHLTNWTAQEYFQATFAQVGYFHRKDYRNSEQPSQYEGKGSGEQFELYTLYNNDDSKGVDIEVWADGDTDVFLTLYRPTSDVKDLFPGS
jgi:hypothetical protein